MSTLLGATPDPVQVLVIGAGMGGAAITKILAEAGLGGLPGAGTMGAA